MPSLFRPNGRKDRHDQPQKSFTVPSRYRARPNVAQTHAPQPSEFGGLQNSRFGHKSPTPVDRPHAVDSLPPILPPKYSFAHTILPSRTTLNSNSSFAHSQEEELRSKNYGLLGGVGSHVVLNLSEVGRVISVVGRELEQRGLTTPRLFSNQALELSPTRIRSLIRSFVDSLRSWSDSDRDVWVRDLRLVNEHDLGWLLRWALGRIIRIKEGTGETLHGLLDWEVYEEWRGRERASQYPQNAFPFLSGLIPAEVYHPVLAPLLRLLSRFAAHSHLSGLTPHALAAIFSPFLFDIPTSSICMAAHTTFVRASCATEHLLLAYIRSSGQGEGLGVTNLPARLEEWVTGYPAMVASDAELARASPRKGARAIRCERACRIVRAYSKDLIASAETWAANVDKWDAWDRVLWNTRKAKDARPRMTTTYMKRLCIHGDLPTAETHSSKTRVAFAKADYAPGSLRRDRTATTQAGEDLSWGGLLGQDWSAFEEAGFDTPALVNKIDDIRSRLQFDLNESAKMSVAEKRRTLNWSEFADPSGGFTRTDPVLDISLSFAKPLALSIEEWPKERDDLNKRLQKSQKLATPFHYDTTPRVGLEVQDCDLKTDQLGRIYLEEAFLDWWADWAIGGGWMPRDELTFRECSWALIEYKALPSRSEDVALSSSADPRTSQLWFLFEEKVPLDYQLAVADPKKKKTLTGLFHSRKKKANQSPPKNRVPNRWELTDFDRLLLHSDKTKKLSLSRSEPPASPYRHLGSEQSSMNPPTPLMSPPRAALHNRTEMREDHPVDKEGKSDFFTRSKEKVIHRARSATGSLNREKMRTQRAHEVDHELRSASGASSSDQCSNDGITRERERWMEILIANGARPMDRQDPRIHIRSSPTPPRSNPSPQPSPGTIHGAGASSSQDIPAPAAEAPKMDGQVFYASINGSSFPYRTPENSDPDLRIVTPQEHDMMAEWRASEGKSGSLDGWTEHEYSSSHGGDRETSYDYRSSLSESCHQSLEYNSEGRIPGSHERPISGQIFQPSPKRDTIHNIVDTYRDSAISTCSDSEEPVITFRSNSDTAYPRRFKADELLPPTLGPAFDLTPGREPSPARYKHGEPLQLVGEEEEENEYR